MTAMPPRPFTAGFPRWLPIPGAGIAAAGPKPDYAASQGAGSYLSLPPEGAT